MLSVVIAVVFVSGDVFGGEGYGCGFTTEHLVWGRVMEEMRKEVWEEVGRVTGHKYLGVS